MTFFSLSCVSLAESLYILSPRKPFVNTFYKLFCAFLPIFAPLYMLSRAFLCASAYPPPYLVSVSTFLPFLLYGVCYLHLIFVCFCIFSYYYILYVIEILLKTFRRLHKIAKRFSSMQSTGRTKSDSGATYRSLQMAGLDLPARVGHDALHCLYYDSIVIASLFVSNS